jgi:lysophospholipase L1-like esterase
MRPTSRLVLAAVVLLVACGPPEARAPGPLVVLLGDSTTAGYGGSTGFVVAPTAPLSLLTALLPETSRWRDAVIVNLGVPNSTSRDWAVATRPCPSPPALGPEVPAWAELGARACRSAAPLVSQVAPLVGRPIDTALVVLGTNDPYHDPLAAPAETAANLRRIAAALAPARVLIASPFLATHPKRAAFVESLAAQLAADGLLTGPDFARIRLPLDDSGVHLTYGGFVAASALWLDALLAVDSPRAAAAPDRPAP